MKKIFLLLIFLPAFSFAQVKTVWKDTRFLKAPLHKVVVMGQFFDKELRTQLETNVVEALQKKNIGAVAAQDVMIYDSMYFYSAVERILDSVGADGLLIIRMVNVRETDMFVMPQELIPPFAYNYYEYYSFYYYHDLPIIANPNYYRKPNLTFRIDANLYQNKGDMVVWGGQSKVLNPLDSEKVFKSLGKKITKRMMSEKVIRAE